ncbi:class I adenylate-forming enzyme family protein [Streptomyces sp. NPDC020898]|uniref:class I adenylate-forming enzyme family protein n=1 Tax=Streptomyces sp. NPDC020898 TaxID=3365101 RepID=UPI0037AC18F8
MLISRQERARICSDTDLGAGNVLARLTAYGRPLDEVVLRTDGNWQSPDGSCPDALTLGQLCEIVETYAGWYTAQGVRPRDPVALHSSSSAEFAVNFLALTSLGAIPSFVNGNLPPGIAREYIRRQGAVGAFTDREHRAVLSAPGTDSGLGFCVTAADIRPEHRASLPPAYPYRHDPTDPVLISHSSGTTGMPKGVPHTHRTLMYAQLHRLRYSTGTDMERTLVGLPGAHNAMVATLLYCLLLRTDIKLLSSQGGPQVLDAIEEFRPTTVLAFAGTFGEMAAEDLDARDLSSVQVWFNTGDAAHEAHIRALVQHGSHQTISRTGKDLSRVRLDGSVFVDGLGSSEAGYSVFHNRHTKDTAAYSRCVGRPISFAEAAVLAEDGTPLPPGEIGRLGLKSPTLTPGYWNDSLTWNRMRLGGYWLTGDLAHQDEDGNFYHLDRAPDAIRTPAGVVFSTRTEELLLRELPELTDCTVVGVAPDGVRADWDGDGTAEAYALLQLADEQGGSDEELTDRVNAALTACAFPPVTRALRMKPDDVAKGATGKVLKRVMRDRFAAVVKEQQR